MSSSEEFVDSVLKEPRIIASLRPKSGFYNQVGPDQLNIHNKWAKPAYEQSKYAFSIKAIKNLPKNEHKKYENDVTVQVDKNAKGAVLELKRIQEIMSTKCDDNILPSISLISSLDVTDYPTIPNSLMVPKIGWIDLTLDKCTLPEKYSKYNLTGFVQLIHSKKLLPLSEQIRFKINQQKVVLTQTNSSTVHFPIYSGHCSMLFVINKNDQKSEYKQPLALNLLQISTSSSMVFVENIVQSNLLSKSWAKASNNNDELIKSILNNNDSFDKIDIDLQFKIVYTKSLEKEFTYSYSLQPNENFYASPVPPLSILPTPTISLFGLQVFAKFPSEAKIVFLKLYVSENISNVFNGKELNEANTLNLFSGIEMGKFVNCYTTSLIDTSSKSPFFDLPIIFIDHEFKQSSFVLICIYTMEKTSSDPVLFGYSALPFYQDGSSINNAQYKLNIFEAKKPPKDIKQAIIKKGTQKYFLQLNVKLPAAYFPPSAVKSVIDALMPEQALPPNFKEQSLENHFRQLLPLVGKLLSIINTNTAYHLIHFLDIFESDKGSSSNPQHEKGTSSNSSHEKGGASNQSHFEKEKVNTILKSWIYNVMDPLLFGPNFIDNLCIAFETIIIENLHESREELQMICSFIPFLFDILIVSISTPNVKYNSKLVIKFLELIPDIICEISNKRTTSIKSKSNQDGAPSRNSFRNELSENRSSIQLTSQEFIKASIPQALIINTAYSNLLSIFIPIFGFDVISKLIFKYIRHLTIIKKVRSDRPILSYLQFSFLMQFSYSEQFIVNLALKCKISEASNVSPYIPLLSQIFHLLSSSFSCNDKDSVEMGYKFFKNICLLTENIPSEIQQRICFILFPLINIISSYFDGKIMKNNPVLQQSFLSIVFHILNNASRKFIQEFFGTLGYPLQTHFLKFILNIILVTINSMNIKLNVRPFYKKRHSAEMPVPSKIDATLLDLTTRFVLHFINTVIDMVGPLIKKVVTLLSRLYNSYQPISNIPYFFNTISLIIKSYPISRSLISWLLSLLSFAQHDTKCLACALLMLVFKADFDNSQTVIISSVDMMDSLTGVLLALPLGHIPTYKLLIERIIELTKTYKNPLFEKQLIERMKASLVISDVVESQKKSTFPLEIRSQHIMRIADQYKIFPSMRLKWLAEIVKVNSDQKNYVSAFVTQIHICALIETVVEQLSEEEYNNQSAPDNYLKDNFYLTTTMPIRNAYNNRLLNTKRDFSFMPEILETEAQLNVKSLAKDATSLLTDFNITMLLEALDKALSLGKSAGLFYSMRPLLSLQIRIYQSMNDSAHLATAFDLLSQNIVGIQSKSLKGYEIPFSFFLVEHYNKENKDTPLKQIFCVENSQVESFMNSLNTVDRFKGEKVTQCTSHSIECSKQKDKQVCVVRINPCITYTDDFGNRDQFEHCFKVFTSIRIFDEKNEIEITKYTTKDYLPHYRWSALVIQTSVTKEPLVKYISNELNKDIKMLNKLAFEFESFYALKPGDEPSNKFISKDLHRISDTLKQILTGNDSLITKLDSIKSKDAELARSFSNDILKGISRVISVFRRAVFELQTKSPYDQLLNLCEVMANDFSTHFEIPKVSNEIFVNFYDPMNDGINYD